MHDEPITLDPFTVPRPVAEALHVHVVIRGVCTRSLIEEDSLDVDPFLGSVFWPFAIALDIVEDFMDISVAVIDAHIPDRRHIGPGAEEWQFADVVLVGPPGWFAWAGVGVEDYEEVEVWVSVNGFVEGLPGGLLGRVDVEWNNYC